MNGEARRGRDRKMVARWQEKRVETVRQVRYLGVNIYERMAFEGHSMLMPQELVDCVLCWVQRWHDAEILRH